MISQQALFTQMELKLHQAKAAQTEAQMREAVSALQALCNVVLDSTDVSSALSTTVNTSAPIPTPPLMQQQPVKQLDDANGSSIFDF